MSLVNELIKGLLPEQEKKKVVAVYGGGFKPPTKGHFAVVKKAIKDNHNIDEFIILLKSLIDKPTIIKNSIVKMV